MYMNRLIFSGIIYLILCSVLFGQGPQDIIKRKIRYGFEINRRPPVNFNIHINYLGQNWKPKLYVAVSIQNDVLQFERRDNFQSEYQISVAIRHKDDEKTIINETWSEKATQINFDVTNSRKEFQYHTYTIEDKNSQEKLTPGEYDCLVEVRDKITKKSYRNKRSFVIKKAPKDENWNVPSEIAFLYSNNRDKKSFPLVTSSEVLEFNIPYYLSSQ